VRALIVSPENKMPAYSVIVDLEATCCDQNSFPREEMEIVEIGAVRVSSSTGEIESEFGAFVKPVRNPILTEFCSDLTTISQEDLKDADSYPQVLAAFWSWLEEQPDYDFCSWGDYDKKQFMQDCEYHRLAYPFSGIHRNLKAEFSAAIGGKKRFGLGGAIRKIGLEFEGTAHRGIDDARNIARIYRHLLKKQRG
jgi:inhibitor of KinA sporulation pathway (predicted exonuclease)